MLLGESFLMFQRIMLCSACSPRFGLLALEDEGNTMLQNIKNCLPSDRVTSPKKNNTQQHCREKLRFHKVKHIRQFYVVMSLPT